MNYNSENIFCSLLISTRTNLFYSNHKSFNFGLEVGTDINQIVEMGDINRELSVDKTFIATTGMQHLASILGTFCFFSFFLFFFFSISS